MIRSIFMLFVGFVAGVMLGPQLSFDLDQVTLQDLNIKDLPKLIQWEGKKDQTPKKVVTKVIDGDSILVEGGQEVRLLAVDADEEGQPCYEEAKQRLTELVMGKKVTLEKDSRNKDQYGRLLRFVKVGEMNVNKVLLKEGVAAARFYPGDEIEKTPYVEAEQFAQENNIGCKWRSVDNATSTEESNE